MGQHQLQETGIADEVGAGLSSELLLLDGSEVCETYNQNGTLSFHGQQIAESVTLTGPQVWFDENGRIENMAWHTPKVQDGLYRPSSDSEMTKKFKNRLQEIRTADWFKETACAIFTLGVAKRDKRQLYKDQWNLLVHEFNIPVPPPLGGAKLNK